MKSIIVLIFKNTTLIFKKINGLIKDRIMSAKKGGIDSTILVITLYYVCLFRIYMHNRHLGIFINRTICSCIILPF